MQCHEDAQEGGARLERRHAMACDDCGHAVVRRDRRALEQQRRHATQERHAKHVRLPSDPPGRTDDKEDILVLLEAEHRARRVREANDVAAGRVHDALGLAGGA